MTTTETLAEFCNDTAYTWPRGKMAHRDRRTYKIVYGPIAWLVMQATGCEPVELVDETYPRPEQLRAVEAMLGLDVELMPSAPTTPGHGTIELLGKLQDEQDADGFVQAVRDLLDA